MPRALSEKEYSDFRIRLCQMACRLFAEKGLAGVTMRELASALGVSAMTPYRYFRNKEEILATVCAEGFTRLAEALETADKATLSAEDRLQSLHLAYLEFALANPNRYKLMLDNGQNGAETCPELHNALERCRKWLTGQITDMVEMGRLNGNPRLIAYTLWSCLHGAISLQFAGKMDTDCDLHEIIRTATKSLLAAFTPPPVSAATP